ncbi:MAG TPA: SusC/RagA family TonB-linked outer membrane protein [Flavitalea sp.]|nr:SusC/RagA family TonB-linked outer membrane protein [Flavitalea sp.]
MRKFFSEWSGFEFLSLIKKMRYKKYLLFLFPIFLSPAFADAQSTVTGVVKNPEGNPLPGVSVNIKDAGVGVTTGPGGRYSIHLTQPGAVLVFSFIGMKTQEIFVGDKKEVDVYFESEGSSLSEVVVVGYGEQSREKITTSIAKLDNKVLENMAFANAATALQGTIPGLRVINTSGKPGSGPSVLLRGGASINSPSPPIYVIDGIVRSIEDINAEDIESVQALKDAAASAIYGARSNNGVILITTKKGKAGASSITYTAKEGIGLAREDYAYLNARDYIYYNRLGIKNTNDSYAYGGVSPVNPNTQLGYGFSNPNMFDVLQINAGNRAAFQSYLNDGWQWMVDPFTDVDTLMFKDYGGQVQDAAFNSVAPTHDHHLSFVGGNEKGTFGASLGYFKQDGLLIGTKYERYSGRINGSYKIKDNFELTGEVSYSESKDPPLIFSSEANAFYILRGIYPTFKPYDENGNPAAGRSFQHSNPLYWMDKFIRKNSTRRTTFNVGARWEILPDLFLRAQGNIYQIDFDQESFNKEFQYQTSAVPDIDRLASAGYSKMIQQQHNITLDYKKSFSKHNMSYLVGSELFDQQSFSLGASGRRAATDDIYTLNAATERTSISSSVSESRMLSFFGRLNYDYDGRYLLSAVMRYDGISSLSNTWGAFPGISAGWNIHREDFFSESGISDVISVLKPRISYGVNGNVSGVGPYEVQGAYGLQTNYNGQAGFLNTGLVNRELRWEKSASFESGLDLGLFNNRIVLIASYFRRVTSDLLTNLDLPSYTGFNTFRTNFGSLLNSGFEASLSASLLNNASGLRWDVSFNASYVKNRILKLPYNGNENNRQGGHEIFDPKQNKAVWVGGLQEGGTLGDIYGFQQLRILRDWDDVNKTVPNRYDAIAELYGPQAYAALTNKTGKYPIEPGDVLWADIDGNDVIDSYDRSYMGNIYPKWTGGFSTTVSYKNFYLYGRLDYALGHTIYNYALAQIVGQYSGTLNMPSQLKDSWTPENPNADLPKFYYADLPKLNIKRSALHNPTLDNHSSPFYEKGDYLAFREITLSYSFPKSLISKIRVTDLRMNVTGQNLGYLKKYSGASPELGGVDVERYPVPKAIILGLKLTF